MKRDSTFADFKALWNPRTKQDNLAVVKNGKCSKQFDGLNGIFGGKLVYEIFFGIEKSFALHNSKLKNLISVPDLWRLEYRKGVYQKLVDNSKSVLSKRMF